MRASGRMCFCDHSYAIARGPGDILSCTSLWGQNSMHTCCHDHVSLCPKCQDIAVNVCSHIPMHREWL